MMESDFDMSVLNSEVKISQQFQGPFGPWVLKN